MPRWPAGRGQEGPGRIIGVLRLRCETAAVSSEPELSEPELSEPVMSESASPPADRANVVVLSSVPTAIDRIQSRFPDLEVVDISGGVPSGVRGDVLFGGLGLSSAEAMSNGVQWVQISGTGIDGIPAEVRAAPLLTSARGASAVAISEYVIATMGAFAQISPATGYGRHRNAGTSSRPGPWPVPRWAFMASAVSHSGWRGRFGPRHVGGGPTAARCAESGRGCDHDDLVPRSRRCGGSPGIGRTGHRRDAPRAQCGNIGPCPAGGPPGEYRPGIVGRSDALRGALDDGSVARASLDVTTPEPLPAGHWMFDHPKVFLTPHASWAGETPLAAATEFFCQNLERYLAGEPLEGVVGPDGY